MATLIIDEHKKNEAGRYDDVRRITNADLVKTADGGNAEEKLAAAAEHIANKDNPHGVDAVQIGAVPTSRKVNNKSLSADVTLSAGDVGADAAGSATKALSDAKEYADQKAVDMVTISAGGAIQTTGVIGSGPYTIEFSPEEDGAAAATDISYQNTASGLSATNVQDAIDELHTVASNAGTKPKHTAVTLIASGWNSTSKTQKVTVPGILADETKQLIMPMPARASQNVYVDTGISCTLQEANGLTFKCRTVPTEDILVYVVIQEVAG